MPRDESYWDKSAVIRVQNRREDDLLETIVKVASKKKNFLSHIHCVVRAAVQWLLAEIWHVFAVVDSQEGINFAFKYHQIKDNSKNKIDALKLFFRAVGGQAAYG